MTERANESGGHATRAEICERLHVRSDDFSAVNRAFPVRWPRYYLNLVDGDPLADPIAQLGRPFTGELADDGDDIDDPVSDLNLRPVPFVVRKHADRVIILTTKKCHFYCRFCFRRQEPVGVQGEPGPEDWSRIDAFLRANPVIEEAILSGGDPLTLTDAALFEIRDRLSAIDSITKWRIHTRAPVHFPQRVTPGLVRGLAMGQPLRVMTHFNHAREITSETARIAGLMADAGIELYNQTVLLAGVNDHADAQTALWCGLLEVGIKPYYLHHPDRVKGNAAFRVSIPRGLAVYRGFLAGWSGAAPRYVLDLPDGRGKVPVADLEAVDAGVFHYRHPDGAVSRYLDLAAAR